MDQSTKNRLVAYVIPALGVDTRADVLTATAARLHRVRAAARALESESVDFLLFIIWASVYAGTLLMWCVFQAGIASPRPTFPLTEIVAVISFFSTWALVTFEITRACFYRWWAPRHAGMEHGMTLDARIQALLDAPGDQMAYEVYHLRRKSLWQVTVARVQWFWHVACVNYAATAAAIAHDVPAFKTLSLEEQEWALSYRVLYNALHA